MKNLIMFFAVSLSITLSAAPVAIASFSEVFTDGSLTVPAGVTLASDGWSYVTADSLDSTSNSDSDSEWGYGDRLATVDIGSARDTSWTTNLYVASESVAVPPLLVTSKSVGLSFQSWQLTATTTGDKEFTLYYTFSQDMSTDIPGDWAYGDNFAYLVLYNDTTHNVWENYTGMSYGVSDADSFTYLYNGDITVKGWFNTDDTGKVPCVLC